MEDEVLLGIQSAIPVGALVGVTAHQGQTTQLKIEHNQDPDEGQDSVAGSNSSVLSNALASESSSRRHGAVFHHFFGRVGHLQRNKTTRHSWKQFEPFEDTLAISWVIPLSPGNLLKLLHGFTPIVMDDKWFIYATGPDAQGVAQVNFHRSWGGSKVAELRVEVTWKDDVAAELWTGQIVQLTISHSEGKNAEQDLAYEIEWIKYQVLVVCSRVLYIDLVDEIKEPAKWMDLRDFTLRRRENRPHDSARSSSQESSQGSPRRSSYGSQRSSSQDSLRLFMEGSPRPSPPSSQRNSLRDSQRSSSRGPPRGSRSESPESSTQDSSESSQDGRHVYRAFTLSKETEEDIERLGGMGNYLRHLPPGTTVSFT